MKKEFFELARIDKETYKTLSAHDKRKAREYYDLYLFAKDQGNEREQDRNLRFMRMLGSCAISKKNFH